MNFVACFEWKKVFVEYSQKSSLMYLYNAFHNTHRFKAAAQKIMILMFIIPYSGNSIMQWLHVNSRDFLVSRDHTQFIYLLWCCIKKKTYISAHNSQLKLGFLEIHFRNSWPETLIFYLTLWINKKQNRVTKSSVKC